MTAARPAEDAASSFDPLRPRLIRIAYRMLGSVADAEDVVQDAFLRWLDADRAAVLEPEAYLRRVVTRLCLDQLKSARRRRETYIGPWLPEPLVEPDEDAIDDVTLPLMMALERLSPLERAAFLLHDVFGVGFEEVAETIGREPATCRQLASRARSHVRAARPRFPMPKERGLEIAAAFYAATRSGDMDTACARFSRRTCSSIPTGAARGLRRSGRLSGSTTSCRFQAGLRAPSRGTRRARVRYGFINGLPGFVTARGLTACKRPRLRSRTARSPASMSCAIRTSSGISAIMPCTEGPAGRYAQSRRSRRVAICDCAHQRGRAFALAIRVDQFRSMRMGYQPGSPGIATLNI